MTRLFEIDRVLCYSTPEQWAGFILVISMVNLYTRLLCPNSYQILSHIVKFIHRIIAEEICRGSLTDVILSPSSQLRNARVKHFCRFITLSGQWEAMSTPTSHITIRMQGHLPKKQNYVVSPRSKCILFNTNTYVTSCTR